MDISLRFGRAEKRENKRGDQKATMVQKDL